MLLFSTATVNLRMINFSTHDSCVIKFCTISPFLLFSKYPNQMCELSNHVYKVQKEQPAIIDSKTYYTKPHNQTPHETPKTKTKTINTLLCILIQNKNIFIIERHLNFLIFGKIFVKYRSSTLSIKIPILSTHTTSS